MASIRHVVGRPRGKKNSRPAGVTNAWADPGADAVRLDVGQHERLRVGRAPEADAGEPSHGAALPVAADDEPGANLRRAVVGSRELARDPVAVLPQSHELDETLDRQTVRGEVGTEDLLGDGLREEQQVGIGGVLEPELEQVHLDRASREVHHQVSTAVTSRDELGAHAEAGEHLQGPRLDRQRARLVHPVREPVDEPDRRPFRTEERGQRQARRAGSRPPARRPRARRSAPPVRSPVHGRAPQAGQQTGPPMDAGRTVRAHGTRRASTSTAVRR